MTGARGCLNTRFIPIRGITPCLVRPSKSGATQSPEAALTTSFSLGLPRNIHAAIHFDHALPGF